MLRPYGVSEELGKRLAADERLSPGHVEAAARSLELAAPTSGHEADKLVSRILEGTLSVQGRKNPAPIQHDGPAYDLSLLRASEDLDRIVNGLAKTGKGSVCLYGPPGTGKTAFVHHVAECLGRPMMLKRASDILNPFVGMSEKNIAKMFRDAAAERAVLLLDEADGMLRDRRHANQRWELTETNEMLTQMESFEGIFFCSTNLVDELDRASLRRFALKIRIDPPGEEARWRLFLAALARISHQQPSRGRQDDCRSKALGVEGDEGVAKRYVEKPETRKPWRYGCIGVRSRWSGEKCGLDALGASRLSAEIEAKTRRRLEMLANLTPGDTTAVIRRMRILGLAPDPEAMLDALAEELAARDDTSGRAVGFRV